jgi:3-hydroxyacyl-CoA dehydrogenase
LERISFDTSLDRMAAADLVIEAVPEHLDLKREIFGKLDGICGSEVVLATNTVKLFSQHYAGADDIDIAMKAGCGYPMGPFELLDIVGLDVSLAIQWTLYQEFREPGLAPTPLLEHLVTAGYLGRKTGRGFRTYG